MLDTENSEAKKDRKSKDFEPTDDEKTAVETWLSRVRRAEDDPKRKSWVECLPKLRSYSWGSKPNDESGTAEARTNLVFATMAAMMPHLYAKNPDISIAPTAACPKERLPVMKKFGATAEVVLGNMLIKEGKLKKRVKANVRATMTTAYGVLKMVYQKDLKADPLTLRRIEDSQNNLARIASLEKDLKEGDDVTMLAQQRDELKAQLQGLMSGNEVQVFKGFVVDRVRSEDFVVLDDSVAEFDEYVDASALGHIVWMTVSAFKTQFGYEPFGATRYNRPFSKPDMAGAQAEGQAADDMYVCVVEIWDKEAQVVRTVARGMIRWCREPYAPENTPQRWYPFYILGFNLVEGRWRPISDTELLMHLQEEYTRTRQNFSDVREDSVPVRVFRKAGGLTEEDIKDLSVRRRNRDWIGVEGNPSVPIGADIVQLDGLKIDPQAYDVSLIRSDMDLVVGLSDAGRANLVKPKTATEAEIMQQALGLRVEERRDTNEDMISEMGEAALEILLRDLTLDEVKQIAGEDAAWPDMSVQEIFSMVDVAVRAGSSGKPNAGKEREQWTQLLPVISDAMKKVGELRQSGNYDMAEAVISLLRETLRRFQERIDVDALIPAVEMGEDGQPVGQEQKMGALQGQLQQAQQQLTELQQALEACQADLTKAQEQEAAKVAAENARAVKAQEDAALSKAEIQSRETIAIAEAADRAKVESDRIAADDARHQREMDAQKSQAMLQAASEIVRESLQVEDPPPMVEGVESPETRVAELVGKLDATMLATARTAPTTPARCQPGAGTPTAGRGW